MTFTCPACGATFDTQEQLDEHARREHGASTGKFVCPACGAEFDTQEQLEEHGKKVHGM